MSAPEFSVIIPVYNRQRTVARAIDSVLSQSLQDFELIIVDDASSDDSVKIVQEYKDDRIRLLALKKNTGPGGARNEGLKIVRGNLISFLDSDDAFEESFLKETKHQFESHPADHGFSWSAIWIHRGDTKKYSFWKPRPGDSLYSSFLMELKIGTSTGLSLRREVLEKIGLFNESLIGGEDTDWLLRVAKHYQGIAIDKPLMSRYFDEENRLTLNYEETLSTYLQHLKIHHEAINADRELLDRFAYKICWLAYYTGEKKIGRTHWSKIGMGRFKVKSTFILLLFEILPLSWAKKIHRQLYHLNN
jgi:glycosyltransferase involved in cell wall biosynthesis